MCILSNISHDVLFMKTSLGELFMKKIILILSFITLDKCMYIILPFGDMMIFAEFLPLFIQCIIGYSSFVLTVCQSHQHLDLAEDFWEGLSSYVLMWVICMQNYVFITTITDLLLTTCLKRYICFESYAVCFLCPFFDCFSLCVHSVYSFL